jgi:PAS domain S-box-containing protein
MNLEGPSPSHTLNPTNPDVRGNRQPQAEPWPGEAGSRPAHPGALVELDRSLLEELLAQAPAGIGLMSGPELRWTFVNDRYVYIAGRTSRAEFEGKTLRESLPELDSTFIDLLFNVQRTGEPFFGREMKALLNRRATNQPDAAWFDFVYQPLKGPSGEVQGVLVHAVDVSDKVQARKTLEESEERLRLAQAAAQVGTWQWDPVQYTRNLSPELHRIFGTDASDPNHAQKWASRVNRADWAKVQRMMEEGHRTGAMEFDYRYEHPELGLRWLYCKGSRIQGETRMFGIVQDITARKSAQEASQRLAAIVECSDDAIISKDLDGIVTSWNPCAERMFGYTAQEMIGRPIVTIIPPELHDDESRILSTIARGERIEHFETVRLNKDGERIDVSLTVSPIKDENGRIVGAAKIARDITERKKAENALHTSEKLASVGRLAATVAHEINNPLGAVMNFIYLAKTTPLPADALRYLNSAEEELDRIAQLTRQTLGFYREARGTASIQLGPLVASLLAMFSTRGRSKRVELLPEIRSHSEAFVVPGEIRQVLANLVSNSLDAVEPGGHIRIRVSPATQWNGSLRQGVRLTVADTGPGIAASVRSRLFEPFFTTKTEMGTGLGLWVCKSIVANHHGTIQVKSATAQGKSGTVFSVFVPLNVPATAANLAFKSEHSTQAVS